MGYEYISQKVAICSLWTVCPCYYHTVSPGPISETPISVFPPSEFL